MNDFKYENLNLVSVTYNSQSVIADFISSCLNQTYTDWQLYIIDNASTDNTISIIQSFNDSRITLLPQSINLGFAVATNIGINLALANNAQFILLINNDTVFSPDLFRKLLDGMFIQSIDMVVPKIFYHQPANKLWYAGGYFDYWQAMKTVMIGEGALDDGKYDINKIVKFAPMCCVLFRADLFQNDSVGLLDEKYFVYFEDADWMHKAGLLGKKLLYFPVAVLYHKVSSLTGGMNSKFAISQFYQNRVYFIRKNFAGLRQMFYLLQVIIEPIFRCCFGKYKFNTLAFRLYNIWLGFLK